MKNTRKKMLLSSVAMLLVALVALGSATYAWFTINKTVTADTINVKAGVASGLEITGNNGGDWGRSTHYSQNYDLTPISVPGVAVSSAIATSAFYPKDVQVGGVYDAGDESDFQTVTVASERPTLSTAAGSTGNANIQGVGTNGYFAEYRMGIRSSKGTDLGAVKATITCSDATTGGEDKNAENYAKAVLLDSTGNIVAYYNDAAYAPIASVAAGVPTVGTDVAASSANQQVLTEITDPVYYTLLVWFEGNDGECVDANSGAVANFSVEFTL